MPAIQRNYDYYTYVSDDGTTYNLRASVEWATTVSAGLAARTSGAPRFISSKSQKPRHAIFRDPTTFRTFSGPIGTQAAYAALTLGDTVDVSVPGLATAVSYECVKKVPESVPTTIAGRPLTDHA